MSSSRRLNASLPFAVALSCLLSYWLWLLWVEIRQDSEASPDLGGLTRYLLGIVFLLACLWGLAHLNYRWAFRRWLPHRQTRMHYWTWQCGLTWGIFEVLQLRTERVGEFVDENLLVTVMVMAFVISYGYLADALRDRTERVRLVQQKTEAELAALKAQINPHFLFNVLNTIYSEAQRVDSETVADLIMQLSIIMRFILEESKRTLIPVEEEFRFLEKYLALQRARLSREETFRLSTRLDWDGQPARIAPLLLIPFIENAFQYGVSLLRPSYVDLSVSVEERRLFMHLVNSVPTTPPTRKGAGTGLVNVRQRLALSYPDRHTLDVRQEPDSFAVTLTLNL